MIRSVNVNGNHHYAAQGLKAKEPSSVEYLRTQFANARLFAAHSLFETKTFTHENCSPYRAAKNTSLLHHAILTTHYHNDAMLTSSLFP